jgi:hypothetical protein
LRNHGVKVFIWPDAIKAENSAYQAHGNACEPRGKSAKIIAARVFRHGNNF